MRIIVAHRGIPHAPGFETGSSLARALRKLGHLVWQYGNYYQRTDSIGPGCPWGDQRVADLLIYCEHNDADPAYLELRELDCPKIYWEFDSSMHVPQSRSFVKQMGFDRMLVANKQYVDEFKDMVPTAFLPYAADPDLFYPTPEPRSGVALIGSRFPQRVDFCKQAGVDLVTGVYGDEYARTLRRLDICVHNHASGGDGLLVMRLWEAMASGVLLLTEMDLAHYDAGIEHAGFYVYEDADHCRELVDMLQRDRKVKEWAERSALEFVLDGHTFRHRAEAILGAVQ